MYTHICIYINIYIIYMYAYVHTCNHLHGLRLFQYDFHTYSFLRHAPVHHLYTYPYNYIYTYIYKFKYIYVHIYIHIYKYICIPVIASRGSDFAKATIILTASCVMPTLTNTSNFTSVHLYVSDILVYKDILERTYVSKHPEYV